MNPVDLYVSLYRPSTASQAAALVEVGEGLQRQLEDLSRDPTPERAEAVAANLAGAQRAVLRLREALLTAPQEDVAP
ncbi:hypothetical protein H1235_08015 [Pseudoxanthomonas sp. NC8]|nr:hypothetical protein H1235_08015 [Pseudoxanthomonas sp. NC8]